MSQSYIEHCAAVAAAVDIDALGAQLPGKSVGEQGSRFKFVSLAKLLTSPTEEQHTGLKVPTKHMINAYSRIQRELGFLSFAIGAKSELTPYAPTFMCLVMVEDSNRDAMAILTEDASLGGQKQVTGRSTSPEVREMLYAPFAELGPMDVIMRKDALHKSVAFDVGGDERLLDFTPAPVMELAVKEFEPYQASMRAARRATEDVTIRLPLNTLLGQALHIL